ncbi:MAG: hypothetical protein WCV88_04465 [Patescibacteria group bacterium]
MAIPYWILGIIYLACLLGAVVFFLLNLYHLRRFGFLDFSGTIWTIVTAGVIVIVIFFSVLFLSPVAWLDSGEIIPTSSQSSMFKNL